MRLPMTPISLTLALTTLLATACDLTARDGDGGFRDGDDPQDEEDTLEEAPSDPPSEEDAPSDPPSEEDAPSDPPSEEDAPSDPPSEPPADEAPVDPLVGALGDCAFNLVWTKGPHYNQGTGLTPEMVATHDADTLEFQPSDLNAWVFPGVHGASVLRLDLLGVDGDTGEYILGGAVTGAEAVLTLPELRLDPAAPTVLVDATVQDPASTGPAVLTSLLDDSQTVLEGFTWGLIVDLNGGPNPACNPILESVFGPLF
jgi:hypothetical protein